MLVVAAALTAACSNITPPASAATFVPLSGAGSTWSSNAIDAWITGVAAKGLTVSYAAVGSAAGRADFAQGKADWAASEIPYGVQDGNNANLAPARGYTYVPDTAGGLAFVYNLHIAGQQVTNLRLSGATIAGIFTNKITMWNDPAIAADNPGLTLPAEPIVPVVRTDSSGATLAFTQWMVATQGSAWTAYCAVVGLNPCTQTTVYPVEPGTAMVGQSGDTGVPGYVSQSKAEGAIGYAEYSFAQNTGFPVAKVLNAAGYYTAPTAANVGLSLLKAQVNTDQTANLSQVYTDTDPRAYELSYYSYMIVPIVSSYGFTADKGYTLAAFGGYLLCQGQQQVDQLGYAALPINLVEAGYTQLQKIPGASAPASTSAFISNCSNPTISGGADALAGSDPMPPACDKQGPTQCPSPVVTTTTLAASPDPATVGQTVTLTATETAADGSSPAGSIQFEVGSTTIGSPVAVDSTGTATTTTTFGAPGAQSLSAVFTPTNITGYSASTGTFSETVNASSGGGGGGSGGEPVTVTIPSTGAFALTVATGTVTLTVSGTAATGALNPITVSDTRNTYPGWSVSGQAADFIGSAGAAATISGNQLGWVPTDTALGSGVTLGSTVSPGSPGLGTTAGILASANPGGGYGTSALSANLTLDLPTAAQPGQYGSTLTLTAVTAPP
jgi:phosphate ABC transporter phosphate-binding protein